MRSQLLVLISLTFVCGPAHACAPLPPTDKPTLAEKIAGLEQIFSGTVVGYLTSEGARLLGPFPSECLNGEGTFAWWDQDVQRLPACAAYLSTSAALFRVDAAIVGPASGELAAYAMTWGDGDCNIDFAIGEQWLIAGSATRHLKEPIADDEIVMLRQLAARPAGDFRLHGLSP